MYAVGDKVIVGGLGGTVVDVDTTFVTPLYTVLFRQPVVRVIPDSQMPAKTVPTQAPATPVS